MYAPDRCHALFVLLAVLVGASCSESDDHLSDSRVAAAGTGPGGQGGSPVAGGEGGVGLGGSAGGIPLAADELRQFVEQREYEPFAASPIFESTDHGTVRVYVNPVLEESLAASEQRHPIGSAAIREVYDPVEPDLVRGWGVVVKVEEAEQGAGWVFYEADLFLGDEPTYFSLGEKYCRACHLDAPDIVHGGYELEPAQ